MKRKARSRIPRALGAAALILLALFLMLPYLFPLSAPAAAHGEPPFENNAFRQVNGISFHHRLYPARGPSARGKLLLVHGLAGSTFSFEALAPLVADQGYLVVSVDLPGFGYSDRALDFDHSQDNRGQHLWQLLALLDQELPVDTAALPWHLAGHSMGGGTVAAMALQEPSRSKSLILIDAALANTSRGGFMMQFPPLKQWLQVAVEHFLINEGRIRSFLTSAYGRSPTPEQVAGYLKPLQLPGTAMSFANIVNTAKNEAFERLQGLTLPILAIWGAEDTWVPLSELDKLTTLLPHTSVQIIHGAAHCPMETHTAQFAEILLQWLASD